jgi:anaerobic magnesium-protoporphyrin IX monomethyl ester cyclase
MRFCLINPPIRESGPPKHYPMGLALLAAILGQEGHEVAILDSNAYRHKREHVREEIKREVETAKQMGSNNEGRFDIIGIGNLITTYAWQKEIIQALKKDWPETKIIAGGGCATALGQQMLDWIPELDAVVIGEAEKTIAQIAKQEGDFNAIKGTIHRDGKTIVREPPVELLTEAEFDELPYPNWDIIHFEDIYFPNSALALSRESLLCRRRIDVEATRGCPYICNFCTDMPTGNSRTGYQYRNKYRVHSPEYVAKMLVKARFKLAIDFVLFVDENFDTNRKWVASFCDALEDYDLVDIIHWGATAHVNTVSLDLLQRMRQCGCAYLDFGMESGSDKILRYIKKNATRQRNQQALDWSLRAEINPLCNFMMGQPIETVQTVYELASFLVKNQILVKPFFSTPYPATELYYTQMEKIIVEYGDLETFCSKLGDATELVINLTKFSKAELLGLRELVAAHDLKGIVEFAKTKGEQITDPDTGEIVLPGTVAETEPPVPLDKLRMLEDKDYGFKQEWVKEIQERHIEGGIVTWPKDHST